MNSKGLAILATLALAVSALLPSSALDKEGRGERAEPRTVLFELFTAVNETDCADDENATSRLAAEYGRDRLAILEWFPEGDPLACPQSQDRYRYYAVVNLPRSEVDGAPVYVDTTNESVSYNAYRSAIDERLNVSAPASISGSLTPNGTHGAILEYNVSFKESTPNTLLKVYSFLYEDAVVYAGASSVSIHRFVVRRQVHEQTLTGPIFQPGGWARATVEFELDPSWNPAALGVAVVLQSDATRAVLQSHAFHLPVGGAFHVDLEPEEQTLELSAGESSEAELVVRNTGAYLETVELTLSGPAASWASLSQASVTLAPDQQTTVRAAVSVPAGTPAGGYQFSVRGTSMEDPSRSDEVVVRVNVAEELYYGVSLSPSSAEESVMAGEAATFQIKVKNTGTQLDTIDLVVSGSEASWASLSRSSLQLEPNGEDFTTLTVSVPQDASTGTYEFNVTGTSRGDPTKSSAAEAVVRVSGEHQVSYGVDIQPSSQTRQLAPGESTTVGLLVTNTGSASDIYDLSKTGNASGWAVISPLSIQLGPLETGAVNVKVDVPSSTGAGTYIVNVRATSRGDTSQRGDAQITLEVSTPEEPPRVTMVSHSPADPTSRDAVTVTAVASGTAISRAELNYSENGESRGPIKMTRSGTSFTAQLGPFGAKTVVKYYVTVYSESGKSNRSADYTFTVRAAPVKSNETPGFGALLVAGATLLATGLRRWGPLRG
ncbi:MAG: COG1470 family protein [Thermoplasmatota archaeon]